jgi:DNA-binding NarL/FixJ family response regulator
MNAVLDTIVVEDEPLYRELLCTGLMSQLPGIRVAAAFATAEQLLEMAPDLRADVLLTDIDLGDGEDGYALAMRLASARRVRGVVLLSNFAMPALLADAPTTGGVGWAYLLKTSVSDLGQLDLALRGAAAGDLVVDATLTDSLEPQITGPLSNLTSRQSEVLTLMANGWSNQHIADALVLSVRSVESVVSDIIRALSINPHESGINARVACVAMYLRSTKRTQPRP